MKINFYKYQATGNDFVILDNRESQHSFSKNEIERICDRKFGIGADGLMLIERDNTAADFDLVYYNSDGSQSLCGNGSRAAVAFASSLGIVNGKASFHAYDGVHEATLLQNGDIRLRMNDVSVIEQKGPDLFIQTGSPHFIRFVDHVSDYPVFEEGRAIRFSEDYKPGGTNVNFVELLNDNTIFVRTYERGVENETLSCGTGVTAAALAVSFQGYTSPVKIETPGGQLSVEFKAPTLNQNSGHAGTFTDVFLIGPAKMVFRGELEL
jgi:diaminopimelate epimerase